MGNREAMEAVWKKYHINRETPYLPSKEVKELAEKFSRFVNCFDGASMVKVGVELATDSYAQEYMKEHGLSVPKTEEEALDRGLAAVGEELANDHRTLQQNFMRVLLAFIEIEAACFEAGDGFYDLRNEDTVRLCHAMWTAIKDRDDLYLRMV